MRRPHLSSGYTDMRSCLNVGVCCSRCGSTAANGLGRAMLVAGAGRWTVRSQWWLASAPGISNQPTTNAGFNFNPRTLLVPEWRFPSINPPSPRGAGECGGSSSPRERWRWRWRWRRRRSMRARAAWRAWWCERSSSWLEGRRWLDTELQCPWEQRAASEQPSCRAPSRAAPQESSGRQWQWLPAAGLAFAGN